MHPNGFYYSRKGDILDRVREIDGIKVATSGYSVEDTDPNHLFLLLIKYWWESRFDTKAGHKTFLDYPVAKEYAFIAPEILVEWGNDC